MASMWEGDQKSSTIRGNHASPKGEQKAFQGNVTTAELSSQQMVLRKLDIHIQNKLDLYIICKNNLKWIKDLQKN